MAKNDLVSLDGEVTNISSGGVYGILLDNGHQITGKLCSKNKKFRIKVVVEDRARRPSQRWLVSLQPFPWINPS